MALGKFEGVASANVGKLAALDIANVGKVMGSDLSASDIEFVGFDTVDFPGSNNYLYVPKPAGVVAGDLMVISICAGSSGFSSYPAGWTFKLSGYNYGGTPFSTVCFKLAGASEPASYLFSGGYTWRGGICLAFRNVNQTTPTGNWNYTAYNNGSSYFNAPTINIQKAKNWAVQTSAFAINADNTMSCTAGWTMVTTTSKYGAMLRKKYDAAEATGVVWTKGSYNQSPYICGLLEIQGV